MVSDTQCSAWNDLVKKWSESKAAALKWEFPELLGGTSRPQMATIGH